MSCREIFIAAFLEAGAVLGQENDIGNFMVCWEGAG